MTKLFTLEHIGLAAKDTVALKDWYTRVLDAELVHQMQQTPPAFLLNLSGVLIELYAAENTLDQTSNNRLAGWRHIALKVSSIETARAYLESKGVEFTEAVKPAGGGGRVLFFKDPENNLLHFTERLPGGFV